MYYVKAITVTILILATLLVIMAKRKAADFLTEFFA